MIVHEDSAILVVSKPAGLSTQAPAIAGETLAVQVRNYLARGCEAEPFAGTVHRLDRPVSGIVVWAKTRRAARVLARQFERREVRKEYVAVAAGKIVPPEGLWEDWLTREETGLGRVQCCRAGTPRSQLARTRYRVETDVEVPEGCMAIRMWPETGRMHQLRVQLAARGAPILGDRLHGSTREFMAGAIALHARSITIRHPDDGNPVRFAAPVPAAWHFAGIEQGGEGTRDGEITRR